MAATAVFVTAGLAIIRFVAELLGTDLALSLLAPFVALNIGFAVRAARRVITERENRPDTTSMTPVIVFGAGEGGAQIIKAMLSTPENDFLPVALIDDDRSKANLRIQGVPVKGTRADLMEVARATGSKHLLVAIPSAGASVIRVVSEQARRAGLDVRVLPPTQELVSGRATLGDIREVSEADLLGRRAIQTDLDSIAGYITNKRVLVTGAGGSIGSELCRQISNFFPERLIMLDRDESALHGVQLSIEGHALLDSRNLVVANIRDAERMHQVFAEHQPDVVFHAAALKHLPLLEMYPEEGWKTNVEGSNNVLQAAARVGVSHFVNVSTDKAADPTSVLGYTKRIAEQLTSWHADRNDGAWVSVRFGNVLGSRGSMLRTFRGQIEAGGPITVTHPDVTRFFMTPVEACQLVIQAAAVGDDGEALVLDMGEPVRILEVAERLVAASGEDIDIVFTGLRPGEKMHEALVSEGELDTRRAHPLISHVSVPEIGPDELAAFDRSDNDVARESMIGLCRSGVVQPAEVDLNAAAEVRAA
jgi:dTDP-glucose 4,6-dehydratase